MAKYGVPTKHQRRVAKQTLRMNPAMAGVMGGGPKGRGQTRKEAKRILKKTKK